MDIEHKRLYLKYKKKYLELKQSGGYKSKIELLILGQSTGDKKMDKTLLYLANDPTEDELYKKIAELDKIKKKVKPQTVKIWRN